MSDAVIFIPSGTPGRLQWLEIVNAHCAARGWSVVAVVAELADAIVMLRDQPRLKLVTGTPAMLTDSHTIEIVTEARGPLPANQRRPVRIHQKPGLRRVTS